MQVDKTVSGAEAIMSRCAYYAKVGVDHSCNWARLLIPVDLPSTVVLDATATQQVLWELLGDRAVIVPIPPGARCYERVRLHVARTAAGIGKTKMKELASKRILRVLDGVAQVPMHDGRGCTERSTFLCCHKDAEVTALSFETPFKEYRTGHWEAVDGKNDWQNMDTAIILRLPYRDHVWSTNVFFALQGLRDAESGDSPITEVQKTLSLGMEARKSLEGTLKDAAHPLTKMLADIGVRIRTIGVGRGAKTHLVKA